MQHVIGGYYLVEGVEYPSWSQATEPPTIFWSISDCIATVHPHVHLLSWSTKTDEQLLTVKQELQLSDQKFLEATHYVDTCFNANQLGWPSVWLNIDSARFFASTFLSHRKNIKLLGVAIPEEHYQKAVNEYKPTSEQYGETGTLVMLRRNIKREGATHALGYEILGYETGGNFHSFVCNGLEKAYTQELGIALNSHGLISEYTDAENAANYTNLETTGAEPVFWVPWLVFELPL